MDNPNTSLGNAVPKPEFYSRFSDPSHPARSGDALALITGGKISRTSPDGRRRGPIGAIVSGIVGASSSSSGSGSYRRGDSNPPAPYGSSSAPAPYGGASYEKSDEYYERDSYRRGDSYEGRNDYGSDEYYGRGGRRGRRMRSDESGSGRRQRRGGGGLIGVVKKKLKTVSSALTNCSHDIDEG